MKKACIVKRPLSKWLKSVNLKCNNFWVPLAYGVYVRGENGMKRHESLLRIAAPSDISVLILGESGSGKEVAARFLHSHSARALGPFVALNCGAIATGLAESVLEGHCKGAFTGAVEERAGVVRSAKGGTLFLDEIGEMPLGIQCKLLRILQEHMVMPLGSSQGVPVDFRLICATNRDLRSEVTAGRFREDLYFRLNVFPVRVPSLREREDFSEVAANLWREVHGVLPYDALCERELSLLKHEHWPGNVRQLKNVLQRYALLKPYGKTLYEILGEEFRGNANLLGLAPCCENRRHYGVSPKWELIYAELQRNEGNRSVTAQKLGISRGCLNYQIKKHLS